MVYLGVTLSAVFVVSLVFILYKFLNDKENTWDVCITLNSVEQADLAEVEVKIMGLNEIDDLMVAVKRKLIHAEELSDEAVMIGVMEDAKIDLEKMEKLMRLSIQRAGRIKKGYDLGKSNVIYFPSCE